MIISILQVAVIAGNLELADVIQFHKPEDIGESGPAFLEFYFKSFGVILHIF